MRASGQPRRRASERFIAPKLSQRKSTEKFTLREIERERVVRLVLSREHRMFSLALRGNTLSDNSCSRTAAWKYGKDRWTRRPCTLMSDMGAKEKELFVLCSFSLALMLRPLPHSSTEQRTGRVAMREKSHFMCFLTANTFAITQLIQLKPSPFERSNLNYTFDLSFFFTLPFIIIHGKKIRTKIAWSRLLLMHGNFTYSSITANLKKKLEFMRLEHRSFAHNERKISLL